MANSEFVVGSRELLKHHTAKETFTRGRMFFPSGFLYLFDKKNLTICYPFFLSISADEISVSDVTMQSIGELDDFNEEEDYVKFLQKEKMSPMVPKLKADHKKLPLPVVTCEWSDKKSESALSTYLPGLGSE